MQCCISNGLECSQQLLAELSNFFSEFVIDLLFAFRPLGDNEGKTLLQGAVMSDLVALV